MASLQNEQIDQSYQGLIKTADNTSTIPFPPQMLQFGDGTTFPIQIADLSAFGAGTQIALKSGTNEIGVDTSGFVINAGGTLNAGAGTVTFNNGTYNFGDAGPATSVDFSNATVTGLPSSGGAQAYSAIGASAAKGVIPYQATPASQASAYKTNQMLSGYNLAAAGSNNDAAYYQIIPLAEGETLSSILLSVQTAAAGSTAEVAIYDLGVGANGLTYVNDQLSTLGTIDTSTTGDKIINLGTPFTMPSGKLNGQVAIVVFRSDNTSAMKGWSQSVFSGWGGNQIGGIYYRAMSPYVDPGVSPGTALPSNIGVHGVGGVAYGAQTSNPLMVLYRN